MMRQLASRRNKDLSGYLSLRYRDRAIQKSQRRLIPITMILDKRVICPYCQSSKIKD